MSTYPDVFIVGAARTPIGKFLGGLGTLKASDLGAMAKRVGAKHLMLTHLGPSLGAVIHNRWKVPGGPLTEADYRKAVEAGGFTGNTIVGTDLATLRLPAK